MDLLCVESALRRDPAVIDCRAILRPTAQGADVPVVYVVAREPFSAERLRDRARAVDGAAWAEIVRISTVPLDEHGQWDEAALAGVPVIDDRLASRAQAEVLADRRVEAAAAVALPGFAPARPLHLADLLPDWQRPRVVGVKASGGGEGAQQEVAADAPAAFIDGGELQLPPGGPQILAEVLENAARLPAPHGLVYHLADGSEAFSSYAELRERAARTLSGLRAAGLLPGMRVIFHLADNRDFIEAFWACQLGGLVPVPTPVAPGYTELNAAVRRLGDVLELLGSAPVLTSDHLLADLRGAARLLGRKSIDLLSVEALRRAEPAAPTEGLKGTDVALLMLTSGSTGKPKGVPLTHQNLIARSQATAVRIGLSCETISINWMPMDHVAGLILAHVQDLYVGARQLHAPTELVLKDPLLWLDLIERHRATLCFAPNFAFGLVVGLKEEVGRRQWDLSCLRVAMNGGEAIVAATARAFLQLLAPHGLATDCMLPAWGMTETSSGVTYNEHFRLATTSDADTGVSIGRPVAGARVRIVDDQDQLLREGQVGHLQVAGQTVTGGYYDNPALNAESFTADGWFRTGDLGQIEAGRLTIAGRDKAVIIINGINYAGPSIEAAVEAVDGVARSFTAACGVADPRSGGAEGLAVFFVPEISDDDALADLLRAIRRAVVSEFGISPALLLPLARPDIPKTSIGKIQRSALQKALSAGRFEAQVRRMEILSRGAHTLGQWFLRPGWRRRVAAQGALPPGGTVLVFGDDRPLSTEVVRALRAQGLAPRLLTAGAAPVEHPAQRVDPDEAATLVRAIADLADGSSEPVQALYLWSHQASPPAGATAQDAVVAVRECARLVGCLRALTGLGRNIDVVVAGNGWQAVAGPEAVDCARATLLGLVRSVAREHPGLRAIAVDLGTAAPGVAAALLLGELAAPAPERVVAWRDGERYVPALLPVVLEASPARPSALHPGGTFLVTGGLGGIAVEVAAWLLTALGAHVILVGRTPLPPPQRQDDPSLDAGQAARVAAFRHCRSLSAQVHYVAADAADLPALRLALAGPLATCGGRLDALLHLAGSYHECRVIDETPASLAAIFHAKIGGTLALAQLRREHPGSALILFSSLISVFGGGMAGGYAAAGQYLDSFSEQAGLEDCYCLNWSAWRDTGLRLEHAASEAARAVGLVELAPEQAVRSLEVALRQAPGRLAIGADVTNPEIARHLPSLRPPAGLHLFAELPRAASPRLPERFGVQDAQGAACTVRVTRLDHLPRDPGGALDRGALARLALRDGAPALAPSTPVERQLAEIWRRVLGVEVLSTNAGFFDLGGQSLLATQLLTAINEQFGVQWSLRDVFSAPSLAAQAARLESTPRAPSAAPGPVVATPAGATEMPLASAQQRLWFLDRINPGNPAYFILASLRLPAPVRHSLVRHCLQTILERHDALRTRFPDVDGRPQQQVDDPQPFELERHTLADGQSLREAQVAFARRPFDLARGPLLRACLFEGPEAASELLIVLHHIVGDGWSVRVLFGEFLALYASDGEAELTPLAAQYGDFSRWQLARLQDADYRRQIEHWRNRLDGALHGFALPTDLPRPLVQGNYGAQHESELPRGLMHRLRALARAQGVTLFITLLAGFKALLARYAQQTDVLVGTVVANRDRGEFEPLIGLLVNLLVLRTDLGGDPRFVELLERVQQVLLDGYANRDVPFEHLVEALRPERDTSRQPLFQVAFDLRDPEITRSALPGVRLGVMEPHVGSAQYDLHLTLEERGDSLVALWAYSTELFLPATIARLALNFQVLLEGVVRQPEQRLSRLPLLSDGERRWLRDWNDTRSPFPGGRCLHELFEAHAQQHPDLPAVVFGECTLSYRELNARANRWAHRLRTLGVGPDVMVGVCLPRSVDMVVAVLAALKAGGAYLPLDPAYPPERLRFMVEDARPGLLLTDGPRAAILPERGARRLLVEEELTLCAGMPETDARSGVGPRNLAYVIYTSGSTGQPKGVLVEHHGWCNVSQAQRDLFGLRPGMRVLQLASLSFDAAAFDISMALANAGTLVLGTTEQLMPGPALDRLLRESRIEVLTISPSALMALPDLPYPDLRVVNAVGEACPAALAERWTGGSCRFFNLYGPTEATIWSSYHECAPVASAAPPIGRPVPNVRLHVLDAGRQLLPVGMPGELYVGGEGVTRGYLQRAELDAERFVPDPFAEQALARLYRTGDLVRINAQGALEFLGRMDHQVKLRGLRIELGEIETLLQRHPAVQEAVVLARPKANGDTALVAYLCAAPGGPPAADGLRTYLGGLLPAYMVPSSFLFIERLPLSPTGKLDRRALPDPESMQVGTDPAERLPRGDMERLVSAIWCEVLQVEAVGRERNFFDAGGHSLKIAQVQSRLAARLRRAIALVDLFQYPTIASLAAFLSGPDQPGPDQVGAKQPTAEPQLAQRRSGALANLQRGARQRPPQ